MFVAIIFAALAIQAAPATASVGAPSAEPVNGSQSASVQDRDSRNDLDRVVCRRENVVGSNRPQRICHTRREWAAMREAAQDTLNRSERDSVNSLTQ